jgi:hypothetical protein
MYKKLYICLPACRFMWKRNPVTGSFLSVFSELRILTKQCENISLWVPWTEKITYPNLAKSLITPPAAGEDAAAKWENKWQNIFSLKRGVWMHAVITGVSSFSHSLQTPNFQSSIIWENSLVMIRELIWRQRTWTFYSCQNEGFTSFLVSRTEQSVEYLNKEFSKKNIWIYHTCTRSKLNSKALLPNRVTVVWIHLCWIKIYY